MFLSNACSVMNVYIIILVNTFFVVVSLLPSFLKIEDEV